MKTCKKCHEEKELSEFHKNKPSKDGHINKCRSCVKPYNAKYREDNSKLIAEYSKLPHILAIRRAYKKTEAGKRSQHISSKKTHARYPNSVNAQNKFNRAIFSGKIIRPTFCEGCDIICNPDGHHDDYNRPLDIRWLCKTCHIEWHKSNTPKNRI